ncbi:MAG: carboxypeptidase-like regulatory domain-containing protein [Prosthecobacter sp.]
MRGLLRHTRAIAASLTALHVLICAETGWSQNVRDPVMEQLQTPFVFYGVVRDQHGQPVPGATVKGQAVNNAVKPGALSTTTDAEGKFTLQDRGVSLRVEISKEGYHHVEKRAPTEARAKVETEPQAASGTPQPSTQSFAFLPGVSRTVHTPDPAAPAVFHLRKAGQPVVLQHIEAQTKVPRDGSPVTVALTLAEPRTQAGSPSPAQDAAATNAAPAAHRFIIRCKTEDPGADPGAPYDWRCEISVEGGTLREVPEKDGPSFTAPDAGYTATAVIDMPKSGPQRWSKSASRAYWLHLADGTFAKINFRMIASGDHFAVISGLRNPNPADRNFEPLPQPASR